MKNLLFLLCLCIAVSAQSQALFVDNATSSNSFSLHHPVIFLDSTDERLVQLSAEILQQDIAMVTGEKPPLFKQPANTDHPAIIIGSYPTSALIRALLQNKKIAIDKIQGRWEAFTIQTVENPFPGVKEAIVIAGSDRRGTAYGVFELSKQMGVSPWYWWADVPVVKHASLNVARKYVLIDSPRVKYRGIFINDEAPALSSWSKEKFGGFNHLFYAKVFELILRLKGNYIWPAMWGNAFYDDDSLNIQTANDYGIVIGTSHHEPLMRAHDEWRRYGSGKWNYDSNQTKLQAFWKKGMERARNEKIVTIGMRGDGDEPMSRETATALLERIVADQREIIEDVTKKPANQTPQLWALYKEVQDYYDKGMRVPDDVTLLLCDDNWGNIRKLPALNAPHRSGGYGIYYHFDYVGGPRNYKWINTNPLPRVWEQMHLAWEYGVKDIWIVNVGDIKPMELPISFFLDYAWNPLKIDAADVQPYTEAWAAQQFGNSYAKEIADILAKYAKYNSRRKPELLDANTFSFHYDEWERVVAEYTILADRATSMDQNIGPTYKDAYYQLLLYPVLASSNIYNMYYYVARNKKAAAHNWIVANEDADKAKAYFENDSVLALKYHRLNNGKWNHMMSQTHIGYTYWQQPPYQQLPALEYVDPSKAAMPPAEHPNDVARAEITAGTKGNVFYEMGGSGVSIEASHITRSVNAAGRHWKVLPDLGRTGSAITLFPVAATAIQPTKEAAHVEYDFYTFSKDSFSINSYHSPTLNFHNTTTGLRYAVAIDNEPAQIISINNKDKTTSSGIWNKWVAENIIINKSKHFIARPGKHTLKYWVVDPGVVLQKIVLDFGDVKESYLGPPETIQTNQ